MHEKPESEESLKSDSTIIGLSKWILVYLLTMSFFSPLAVSLFGVWYTKQSQDDAEWRFKQIQTQSDQRWCDLLRGIDQPPTENPKVPLTERQQEIQQKLHKLRLELGC